MAAMEVEPSEATTEVYEERAEYTLETLPISKLLHYIRKDELVRAIGEAYTQIKLQAEEEGEKLTAKYLKKQVAQDMFLPDEIRRSALGAQAFRKYRDNYLRLTSPEVMNKSRAVRSAMKNPRRGFKGCVATKLQPKDYKDCMENYDRDEYQNIQLVPSGLRVSAYEKTGNPVYLPGDKAHISSLPRNLRAYMLAHPTEYQDYMEETKALHDYLRAVHRNALKGMAMPVLEGPVVRAPKRRRDDSDEE